MARPSRTRVSPSLALTLRQLHSYIGAFIAPSVLFFAVTGSLQLFSLHEAHGGYTPPPLVEALGRVHKDQVLRAPPKQGGPARHAAASHDDDHAAAAPDRADDHAAPARADHDHAAPASPLWSVTALKWVFLCVAVGLIISTSLGLWLALTFSRRKGVVVALLLLGAALPTLLVLL